MTDTDVEGPRLATREDFPEILDLVDRCFRRRDGGMADEWGHCYDGSNPQQHAIIKRDGRVVSNVGCIRETIRIGSSELRAAGITGVATDSRYRGNGYMTQLLEFWLDRMDDLDVPVSELAGNRQRYGRFGWENAGQSRYYRITERSLHDPPDRDQHVTRFDGSDDAIDFVQERYRTLRFRVERDREDFRTHLGRTNLETVLYAEPGHGSYLTFTRDESDGWITEAVGSERGIRALLAYVFRTFGSGTNSLRTRIHPDDPLNSVFASWAVSDSWRTVPHRKVNVRDLPAVLEPFTDQLSRRWRRLGGADGSLSVGIDADDEAATLTWTNDRVDVDRVTETPDIELDRLATTRLLFGYPETVAEYGGHRFLDTVLPLDFYIPRTDQV